MGWYNTSWPYRVKVTVNSSKVSASYTDYPLMLAADNFPADFWTNVKSDGSDIVVTDSNGTTKLPRDLLHINTTANSHAMHLRTKVTLTNATTKTLYVYYGNSSASESNDTNTWASQWKFYLPMYEDPSGTAPQEVDRTANSKDGTSTGSMTSGDLVSGPLHKALELDGSDDGISIGNTEFATAGSVVFWVKPVNRPGSRGENWFRSRSDSPLQLFDFAPTAANTMFCGWYDNADDDRVYLSNTSGFNANTWELWTLAWSDGSSTGLWRNTTLEGYTSTLTAHWNTAAIEFIFGQGTLGNGPAQITISECRYTTQKLSTPTVTLIYNNESNPSTFYSVSNPDTAIEASAAAAAAETLLPSVVLGSISLTMPNADAVATTVAPTILIGVVVEVTDIASASAGTIAPSVILGSITIEMSNADAAARTAGPYGLPGVRHWWYDARTGGFFKDTFEDQDLNPIAVLAFDGDAPSDRAVILGDENGYVRRVNTSAITDDGNSINSNVALPVVVNEPIPSLVSELQMLADSAGATLTYSVRAGDTPEESLDGAVIVNGTLNTSQGRSATEHPRVSGKSIFVTLEATSRWSMEYLRTKLVAMPSSGLKLLGSTAMTGGSGLVWYFRELIASAATNTAITVTIESLPALTWTRNSSAKTEEFGTKINSGVNYTWTWGDGGSTNGTGNGFAQYVNHAYGTGAYTGSFSVDDNAAVLMFYFSLTEISGTLPNPARYSNLETYKCSYNSGITNIVDFSQNGKLQTIDLVSCSITDSFPSVSHMADLKAVYVGNNPITGTIPDVSGNVNLLTLGFQGTNITGYAGNTFPSSLTDLRCNDCQIGNSADVDNILVALDNAGTANGLVWIDGANNATPGPTGNTAKTNLLAKGWTVQTN